MRHLLTALHSFNPKSMVPQKSQPHVFIGKVHKSQNKKAPLLGVGIRGLWEQTQRLAAAVACAYLPATINGTACLTTCAWHSPGSALPLSRFLSNTLQPGA